MKILYDYQVFELQRFGGVSRYFYELIKTCQKTSNCFCQIPIKYSDNEYLRHLPEIASTLSPKPDYYNQFFFRLDFKGKWPLYNLRNKIFPQFDLSVYNKKLSLHAISEGKFDLFHPTFFDDYFLKNLGNKPFVLTIYDMIHEKYPQYYPNNRVRTQKKVLAKAAHTIIAISENTKKDIIEIYNIDESKIQVIYLGSSITEQTASKTVITDQLLPEKYLLFVGGRGIYKNFYPFLKSILPLFKSDKDLYLVCTGEEFSKDERLILAQYQILERVVHFAANDLLLAKLYQKAIAFVFPSLYEGFGLPVLEAFNCGCPVVLSNTSSLPEVGGDAAIYFDPGNAFSIYGAIEEVTKNTALRKQMITKGFEQLNKFSWASTGKQTIDLYEKII